MWQKEKAHSCRQNTAWAFNENTALLTSMNESILRLTFNSGGTYTIM